MAIGPLQVAVIVVGAAMVTLGGYLLSRRVHLLGVNVVATRIILFGLFAAVQALPALGMGATDFNRVLIVGAAINYSAGFALLVTYPDGARTALKRRLLGFCVLPGLAGLSFLAVDPEALVRPDGALTSIGAYILYGFPSLFHFLGVVVFGTRYLRSAPGARRTQLFYVAVPHLFLGLNDGLFYSSNLVGAALLPGTSPLPALSFGVLAFLSVPIVVLLSALRLRRTGSTDDRNLIIAVLAFAPLSLLQLLGEGAQGRAIHLLVDALMFSILYYGVARYALPQVNLRLKSHVSRGTVATAAIAVLFIVQQAVERSVGAEFGILAGAVIAGLGLAALQPLQRVMERTQPGAAAPVAADAYLTFRRLEIYKAAVESAARDGIITDREGDVLRTLRRQLDIAGADADAIERDVRSAFGVTHLERPDDVG